MDLEFKNPFDKDEKVISWLEATMLEGRDGCGHHARVLMPQNLTTKTELLTVVKELEEKISTLENGDTEKIEAIQLLLNQLEESVTTVQNNIETMQADIEKLKEIVENEDGGEEGDDE